MINTAPEVQQLAVQAAVKKYQTPTAKLIALAILAGAYIALGGALSVIVSYGSPAMTEAVPSLTKFLAGAFFPIGLILISLVGGELFTGNTFYLVAGARTGAIPQRYIAQNWLIVYFGNLIGAVAFSYFFVEVSGLMDSGHLTQVIQEIGYGKVSQSWAVIFFKGIAANWLVCLALALGFASRSMFGRLVGTWLPVMAFVTLGYEHSIANMFYIPTAVMRGAEIGLWEAIWNNFIPSTLGNIIGGGLLVGALYSWLYGGKRGSKE
ncbi:MAG: formate/nitrite transporter family protein [Porphyromonas sp.]|nr:formate/nitrite transporter family protein [Porphyromonas sp.]